MTDRQHRVDDEDDVLRRRFRALRAARVAAAGTFAGAIGAAGTRRPARLRAGRSPGRRLALAAAAALPIVVALALHQRARATVRADVAFAREVAPLVEWRSPTDMLLHGPAPVPTWLRSIQGSVIALPVASNGGPTP